MRHHVAAFATGVGSIDGDWGERLCGTSYLNNVGVDLSLVSERDDAGQTFWAAVSQGCHRPAPLWCVVLPRELNRPQWPAILDGSSRRRRASRQWKSTARNCTFMEAQKGLTSSVIPFPEGTDCDRPPGIFTVRRLASFPPSPAIASTRRLQHRTSLRLRSGRDR